MPLHIRSLSSTAATTRRYESLHEQGKRVAITSLVERLRMRFMGHRDALLQLRVWMFSSTARGGGVSEMWVLLQLPGHVIGPLGTVWP